MEKSELRAIAERILLSHIEDIEFLSVPEMTDDALQDSDEWNALTNEQQYRVYREVDEILGNAVITVEFREN